MNEDILKRQLGALLNERSVAAVSKITGLAEKTLHRITKGQQLITPNVAIMLRRVINK